MGEFLDCPPGELRDCGVGELRDCPVGEFLDVFTSYVGELLDRRQAETIGPNTGALVKAIMDLKPHPEQGYRSCLGIMRLAKHYPAERIEAAARRAVAFGTISYKSVKAILEKGLDELQGEPVPVQAPMTKHANLRGPAYYS